MWPWTSYLTSVFLFPIWKIIWWRAIHESLVKIKIMICLKLFKRCLTWGMYPALITWDYEVPAFSTYVLLASHWWSLIFSFDFLCLRKVSSHNGLIGFKIKLCKGYIMKNKDSRKGDVQKKKRQTDRWKGNKIFCLFFLRNEKWIEEDSWKSGIKNMWTMAPSLKGLYSSVFLINEPMVFRSMFFALI